MQIVLLIKQSHTNNLYGTPYNNVRNRVEFRGFSQIHFYV